MTCGHLADPATERAVLGALLILPERLPEALVAGLAPGSFSRPAYAVVFAALMRLGPERSPSHLVSAVIGELDRTRDLPVAGGPAGVTSLVLEAIEGAENPGSVAVDRLAALIPAMAERLVVLAGARRVQRVLSEAAATIERDPAAAHEVFAGLARSA